MAECGPWPIFACYTLAFALQLRKKQKKNLRQVSCKVPVGYDSVCQNDCLLRVAKTSRQSAFARVVCLGSAAIQRGQGF